MTVSVPPSLELWWAEPGLYESYGIPRKQGCDVTTSRGSIPGWVVEEPEGTVSDRQSRPFNS